MLRFPTNIPLLCSYLEKSSCPIVIQIQSKLTKKVNRMQTHIRKYLHVNSYPADKYCLKRGTAFS